jgi:DNA-directed RNA polymerase subunit RPC12/RpoP
MQCQWHNITTLSSKSYVCGYCGNALASEKAYYATSATRNGTVASIYICHHCSKPTFFEVDSGIQVPGSRIGDDVNGINDAAVLRLYEEARDAYAVNAFTASVLSCRKLLMHVAVSKGAMENQSFIEYVEFLSSKGYVPPDAKVWVDHIRTKGNEANHQEIALNCQRRDHQRG